MNMQSPLPSKAITILLLLVTTLCFSTDDPTQHVSNITPINLTCEYRTNPLGVDVPHPRLGWQLSVSDSALRAQKQSAFQIIVASTQELLKHNHGYLWDSGKVDSDRQCHIAYEGKRLDSGQRVYWKVRVWDGNGQVSAWSEAAFWEMGLLERSDWDGAEWIALEELDESRQIVPGIPHTKDKGLPRDVLPQFRKEFSVSKPLRTATLFISGLGQYEARLNGEKIGDHFLDPGWTNYRKTCLYTAYDVTKQLKQGPNAIAVQLGNGMFFIPRERYRKHVIAFGYPQMILKLVLRYADGSVQEIVSDESFRVTPSPITFSSIYGGEDYDATIEKPGWDQPGFDDSAWQRPVIVPGPGGTLQAQSAPPVKVMETWDPVRITHPADSVWIYDMGQNASGIVELTVQGSTGAIVNITPGELLDDNGIVTQKATGEPFYFSYTLKGQGIEKWSPRFTYYGFRYLQVEGAVPAGQDNPNGRPVIIHLKTLHTRNSAKRVGAFACSNQLFNRVYQLIDWAIKSNMASVLTDCPHREKLGWLEQAHLMGASIRYNYNVPLLLAKIVQDMREAQLDNGLVPDIAPEYPVFSGGFRDSPEWGSAFVILPWYIYQWYGDTKPLEENYAAMKRYVAYLTSTAKNHIVSHGLGDWFDIGPTSPGRAQLTSRALTATAMYYYDVSILEKAAVLLGREEDRHTYHALGDSIKQAFNDRFFDKEMKQYATGSQTANAMAIFMDFVDPPYKQAVLKNLVDNIEAGDYKLTAGDIGFRYVVRVLEDGGYSDVIFKMNNRSDVPGYGWQLAHGATSLTESWQAYRNVSNNHMMLGHLIEWFYSGLAGIRTDFSACGCDRIVISPEIIGDVTWVKAAYNSIYGTISNHWRKSAGALTMQVHIPVNMVATVCVPTTDIKSVTESGVPVASAEGVTYMGRENGKAIFHVESGNYLFRSWIAEE